MDKTKLFGFASDHAGFQYKQELKKYVEEKGYKVVDYGTFSTDSTSYAEYGRKLGAAIHDKKVDYGIAVCGTGLGISYALNRFNKVRAARTATVEDAHLARQHNDANALAIGQRTGTLENAKAMVDEFIKTKFEGGRHQMRIDGLDTKETCCSTEECNSCCLMEKDKLSTSCETEKCESSCEMANKNCKPKEECQSCCDEDQCKVSCDLKTNKVCCSTKEFDSCCSMEKDKVTTSCDTKACCSTEKDKTVISCKTKDAKSCCPDKK